MSQVTLEAILSELQKNNSRFDKLDNRHEMRTGFKDVDRKLNKLQQDVGAIREQTATNSEAFGVRAENSLPSSANYGLLCN
jgi:NCAIR mutase (PurE)-related protein